MDLILKTDLPNLYRRGKDSFHLDRRNYGDRSKMQFLSAIFI